MCSPAALLSWMVVSHSNTQGRKGKECSEAGVLWERKGPFAWLPPSSWVYNFMQNKKLIRGEAASSSRGGSDFRCETDQMPVVLGNCVDLYWGGSDVEIFTLFLPRHESCLSKRVGQR